MFYYSKWTSLSLPDRIRLATIFNIPKTGSTHVFSNQIKDDGYKVADIEEGLAVDKLQDYLETEETDLSTLWGMLMEKEFPTETEVVAMGTVTEKDATEILITVSEAIQETDLGTPEEAPVMATEIAPKKTTKKHVNKEEAA